jgi:hypothetical protein
VKRLAIVTIVGWALASPDAARAACADDDHLSTCFDADTLWPHPGPADFAFVGGATTTPRGTFALGLVSTYLARPVVLVAPSADPNGSEFVAVDHLADTTLLFAFGLGSKLDVGVALPLAAYRTGLGVSPLTSQRSAPISHAALRDARVGAGLRLAGSPYGVLCPDTFGMTARFELALPTGDETSFAGESSVVAVPSLAGEIRSDPFVGAFEVGARIRETTDLAGSRIGSQLSFAAGLGADVLDGRRLGFLVEAMILPTLVAQNVLSLDPATGERVPTASRAPLVPAEWQASVRSADVIAQGVSLSLGAGTPLVFGGESALTAPRYRVTLAIRYVPSR